MGRLIAGAQALADKVAGLVLLVHHTGKSADKGLRGHSSLLASLDAAIEATRDERTGARAWRVVKSKDGSDGACHGFALDVVELAVDNDGDQVTSCVIREVSGEPEVEQERRPRKGGNMLIAFDAIASALSEYGELNSDAAPGRVPPGRPVITMERAIEAAGSAILCDPKRRRERANAAIKSLVAGKHLGHASDWIWHG